MKNWKDCNWIGVLIIFAIVLTYFACKEDDPDYSCKCEWGDHYHIVLDTDTLCGNRDCNNEEKKVVPGQRVNGIAVTNREDVDNFDDMVKRFETALGWFTVTQQDYAKTHIKEVKIIVDTKAIPSISNGVLTVGNKRTDADIWGTISEWLITNDITTLFKQFDSSKDTVRLAFDRTRGRRTT
jgi:hypothetical protein